MNFIDQLREAGFDFEVVNRPDPFLEAEKEFAGRLKNEPALRTIFRGLYFVLASVAKGDERTDETRESFLGDGKDITREVGEVLHERYGIGAMRVMHAVVATQFPGDARLLEFAWDGIGEWRA